MPLLAHLHIAPSSVATARPLVVAHGLFGSKQNWLSLAKTLARRLGSDVYALDMRNHGDSPHIASMDFPSMAADVADFIDSENLRAVTLLGHSMGGKVMMQLALQAHPAIHSVISVDMVPMSFNLSSVFSTYISVMQRIEQAKITKQSDADKLMQQYISDLSIRQFLLTNLKRFPGEETMRFRIPLDILQNSLPNLADFPALNQQPTPIFNHPCLIIGAQRANYVHLSMLQTIQKLFPKVTMEMLDTGHWVHSEQPELFINTVHKWLKSTSF